MNDIEKVMNYLVAERAPILPPEALAEVFDRLIWCLQDNGAALLDVRDKWLRGDDKDKIDIALTMKEVYPGNSREEIELLLRQLSRRWPDLQQTARDILDRWDEEHVHQSAPVANGLPL